MRKPKKPEQALTMRWIPVTDAQGRVRMEARWVLEDAVQHPVLAA